MKRIMVYGLWPMLVLLRVEPLKLMNMTILEPLISMGVLCVKHAFPEVSLIELSGNYF